MIPYLLMAGGAYLLIDSLGRDRATYDPTEVGLPTKGYRVYKRDKGRYKKGGAIRSAEVGDSANVKALNKTGVIVEIKGDMYKLHFVDGSENTYSKRQLIFINNE